MASEFGGNKEKVIQVILPNYVKSGGNLQCLKPSAEKTSKVEELLCEMRDAEMSPQWRQSFSGT